LSIFFGLGVALFTAIQGIPTGNAAGLDGFIYGKAASLVAADVRLIAYSSLVVLALSCLLFKEFSLLSFEFY
jgi:manganese/zinc/iron transport system permease protein